MRRKTQEKINLAGGLVVWFLAALAALSTIISLAEMF